jgi:predicted dehydrogenase
VNVGIVGCGVISDRYAGNAQAFDAFDVVACADLDPEAAAILAAAHDLEALSVEELLADPAIDVVLNLTPPAAHGTVLRQALEAGKHVYSEKPLATTVPEAVELVADAELRGLRLGCAPDIFLGSAYQAARGLIDDGEIGEPLSASAAMLVGNQTSWHPNADFFYTDGAGPLLDMGPYYLTALVALLGPVQRVAAFASTRVLERTIAVGPRAGERFTAETPTHTAAMLELADGVTAGLIASFEATGQYVCELEIHGTDGILALPDPNGFAGPLRLRQGKKEWRDVPYETRGDRDARGIGLADLVDAIANDRPHRASAEMALHVVDVARRILAAAAEKRTVDVVTTMLRPEPLPVTPGG